MNSNEEQSNSPILIVGCRRSGTTLLRTILEEHTDLLVHPNEPQFFLELYHRYGFTKISAKSAIEHVLEHPYRAPNIPVAALSGADAKVDLVSLARRYLDAWTAGQTNRRPVFKDPLFVFYLDTVSKLFPGSTVIHIIRDPRANVSSQRLRWPQFSVWTCAMYWKNAVQAAEIWGAHHPHRFVTVSYEALVQNPESTVRQLCDELRLPYTNELLRFRQKEVVFEPGGGHRIKQFTAPDPSHQDLWKQRLSADDIQLIEICCTKEMTMLGYEPVATKKLTPSLQLRKLREQLAYRFYQTGKQLKKTMRRISGQMRSTLVENDGVPFHEN